MWLFALLYPRGVGSFGVRDLGWRCGGVGERAQVASEVALERLCVGLAQPLEPLIQLGSQRSAQH